jgi:hypothetical protein
MLASEKFISTAQKRESVVGSANNIGYVPYSRKSSTAYLSFAINPDAGYTSSILIPKNVKFTTTIDGISYSFLTTQNTTVIPVDGVYAVSNLEVKEGRYFKHKFTISGTDKFLKIPNKYIDTSRLTVNVKESSSSITAKEYKKYTSLVDLTSTSEIYFIQEGSNGLYELYFGDGILGKSLSIGNEVSIEYFVTEGSVPNGAKEFVLDDEVTGLSTIDFTDVVSAANGSMEESIDSVRISAPTNYQAQNRAVTELDFEVLVKQIYPEAKQVSVIGGERYTPKQYGKVFISILKDDLNILSDRDKNYIILELAKKYSGLTVFPVIVDPYIVRLYINVDVKYINDGNSPDEIKSVVFNTIKDFVINDLNTFTYTLRKSRFEALVDSSSDSVLSNSSSFQIYIDTKDVILNTGDNYINFNQEIKPKTLYSSKFTYKSQINCQFYDLNGDGYASIYSKSDTNALTLVLANALSIDYTSGIVTYVDNSYSLAKLSIANSSGIKIITETLSDDIKISNNQVAYVKDDDIKISVKIDS